MERLYTPRGRLGTALFAVGFVALLCIAVRLEFIVSADAIRFLRAVTTVVVVGASVILFRGSRKERKKQPWGLERGLLVLTAAGLVYPGLAFFTPLQDDAMTSTACPGMAVQRAKAYVETPSGGLSVRAGASVTSAQIKLLPGECGIGVDAYCPGAPVRDANPAARFDSRWYVVHQGDDDADPQFVSAAVVRGLLQDGVITDYGSGDRPDADTFCQERGGLSSPGVLEVDLAVSTSAEGGGPLIYMTAKGVYQFGVTAFFPAETDYGTKYLTLPYPEPLMDNASPRAFFSPTPVMIQTLEPNAESVTLVVARCWGVGAAVLQDPEFSSEGDVWIGKYDVLENQVDPVGSDLPSGLDVREAKIKACSEASEIPAT